MTRQRLIAIMMAVNICIYFVFLYFPLLSAGYIWDDMYLLKQLAAEQDMGVQPSMFVGTNFFRPLGYASFWLEGVLFGVNPTTSHLINILLHTVVVTQVFAFCYLLLADRCLFGSRLMGAAAVSLFVCSLPFMAEPVAWVSARFEILCAIFLLLSLGSYFFIANRVMATLFSALSFLLALFSKEAAIPYLVVIPVIVLIQHRTQFFASPTRFLRSVELWGAVGSMLLAVLIYFLMRQFWAGQSVLTTNTIGDVSLGQHAVLIAESLIQYARLLFLPWHDVQPFYAADLKNQFGIVHGLTLGLFVLVGIASLVGLFYSRRMSCLIIIVLLLMLSPVLNLVPVFPGLFSVAPRYLYLPVLVAVLVAVMVLPVQGLSQTRLKILVCAIFLLSLGNFEATRRFIAKYETNEIFWDSIAHHSGVYHQLIALNQVAAKMAFQRFGEAHQIITDVREPLEFGEQALERYEFPLAYYRDEVTDDIVIRIDRGLADSFRGVTLLGWRPEQGPGDVSWLLNMKALMLHQRCADRQKIGELALAAQQLSENRLSSLLILAARLPESVMHWGGAPLERDLFVVEYQKFIMTFLQRDLMKCGFSVYTNRFNKLEVSHRPPPIF